MPVDTFAIALGTEDGGGRYTGDATWPPDGGTFAATNDNQEYVVKERFTTYSHFWMCMRFDTSAIPDTNVISAAELQLYITEKYDDAGSFSLVADWYDYGGNPVAAADWVETPSPAIFTADLGSFSTGGVRVFNLTDLTGISLTGFTGVRLGVSAGTPADGQANGVRVASFDDALQEPRLVVTHDTPGGGGGGSDRPPNELLLLGVGV